MSEENRKQLEKETEQNEQIEAMGQVVLQENDKNYHIH